MPLSNSTTAANGNEREQVLPLLDKVKLKTLKRGRARKRVRVLAADKGYDSKQQRASLRKPGIRPLVSLFKTTTTLDCSETKYLQAM